MFSSGGSGGTGEDGKKGHVGNKAKGGIGKPPAKSTGPTSTAGGKSTGGTPAQPQATKSEPALQEQQHRGIETHQRPRPSQTPAPPKATQDPNWQEASRGSSIAELQISRREGTQTTRTSSQSDRPKNRIWRAPVPAADKIC